MLTLYKHISLKFTLYKHNSLKFMIKFISLR